MQKQWRTIMGTDPSHFKNCDYCPVEQVSWNDVQDFIKKLNQKTGKKYRLPTEAEWEYTARGGNKSKGYTYAGSNTIDLVAKYGGNNNKSTSAVGSKSANELDIYDMSGNVWEWCQDWYGEKYYSNSPSSNPTGVSSGSGRVYRGGSWGYSSEYCRTTNRNYYSPEYHNLNLGFRLCSDR
jgi:formylglycine-generating enzyme required for sulfatase activity